MAEFGEKWYCLSTLSLICQHGASVRTAVCPVPLGSLIQPPVSRCGSLYRNMAKGNSFLCASSCEVQVRNKHQVQFFCKGYCFYCYVLFILLLCFTTRFSSQLPTPWPTLPSNPQPDTKAKPSVTDFLISFHNCIRSNPCINPIFHNTHSGDDAKIGHGSSSKKPNL